MKKLFVLGALVSALLARADIPNPPPTSTPTPNPRPIPGGRIVHEFECDAPHSDEGMIAGVGYHLSCQTQAVAPQYSVRSCSLSSHPVVPNARERDIPLKQSSQDAKTAIFDGKDVEVILNKATFEAVVRLPGGAVMNCAEKQ